MSSNNEANIYTHKQGIHVWINKPNKHRANRQKPLYRAEYCIRYAMARCTADAGEESGIGRRENA